MSNELNAFLESDKSFCHSCGDPISLKFKFCPQCGTEVVKPLDLQHEPKNPKIASLPAFDPNTVSTAPSIEDRQLSIVKAKFLHEIPLSNEVLSLLRNITEERYGVIETLNQDGFLAYFGYPKTQKNETKNAIDCVLKIFNTLPHEFVNSLRIVIHTDISTITEQNAETTKKIQMSGSLFDVADEMLKFCPLGAVVISQNAEKFTHQNFNTHPIGLHYSEKLQKSFDLFKVISKKYEDEFSIDQKAPLTGRKSELKKIEELWNKVKQGQPKIVLVSGEAGIGKSRLIRSFKNQLNSDEVLWFQGSSNQVTQNSAFYTLTELWLHYNELNLSASDDELLKIAKDSADQLGISEKTVLPLLLNLMSMEGRSISSMPENISVSDLKEKITSSVVSWLQKRSDDKPVVFVIEDLHFSDPSTLDLLAHLTKHLDQKRIMLIFTFRPEYQASWIQEKNIIHLHLSRLTPAETKELVHSLCGNHSIPEDILNYITDKTDGVPLFVEELTLALIDTGTLVLENDAYSLKGSLKSLTIPVTLRDSLAARLDLLGQAKSLAQLSAVFGRSLSHNYLRILSGYDEARLQEYLEQLVNAGILVRNETQVERIYSFKHALIQEAAYLSSPKAKRQACHAEVAEMFEKHFPSFVTSHPEIIAFHYSQAGFIDQASQYWLLAGKRASQNSAHNEAIAHFTKGLDLISSLPPGQGRDMRELPLRAAICIPLMALKGWGSDTVEKALMCAYDLCQKTSDTVHLIPILRGLQSFFVIRGPLSTSRKYAEQMVGMARQLQDQALMLESHRALGLTLFFQAELQQSKRNFEKAVSIYEPEFHSGHAFSFGIGTNPKVTGLSVLGWNNLILGFPELALKQLNEAIDYALTLNDSFSLCYAYGMAASFYQTFKDTENTEKYARLVKEFAADRKYVYWKSWGQIFLAWSKIVRAHKSLDKESFVKHSLPLIVEMEEGIKEYRAAGSEQGVPYQVGMLAQVKGLVGELEEGIKLADEALLHGQKYDIHLYDSSITRIKAEILANTPESHDGSEALFRESIEISQKQDAKFFEVRTYVSFYEFLKSKNREAELIPEIQKLYDGFSEGFTVAPDLVALHKFLGKKK